MLSILSGVGQLGNTALLIVVVAVAIFAFILYKFGVKLASIYGLGAIAIATIFMLFIVSNAMTVGSVNQFVFGIYSDGTHELLGSSQDGIFNKSFQIYDENGNELIGFGFLAFADFEKPISEYSIDYIDFSYYATKITYPYNKRVYERPWMTSDQFVLDPGFSGSPIDTSLGVGKVVVNDGYYFFRINPSDSATTVALGDPLTPTRPYPITHNGVTAYPVIFWIDTRMAEQSYGCQLGLPDDNSLQTYEIQLNMLLKNSSLLGLQSGTINPDNSEFTSTIKLRRSNWDETVDFQIYWANPKIYK
ncbi:MAG: hypothetical protein ABFD15_04020 [Methanofastidiosum sp.]